jgi:two-component system, NarL family, nitrate/nitrite response regulator NarL
MIPTSELAVSLNATPDEPAFDDLIRELLEHLKTHPVAATVQTSAAQTNVVRRSTFLENQASLQQVPEPLEEVIAEFDLGTSHYSLIRTQLTPERRSILSPREHEIARLVTCGLPNKVIGDMLEISPWTVATYLRRIFIKLGVSSRAAMVARVIEEKCL